MEDLVDLISKIPMQNYKEEKDGVAKIKLKLKPLNDEVEGIWYNHYYSDQYVWFQFDCDF